MLGRQVGLFPDRERAPFAVILEPEFRAWRVRWFVGAPLAMYAMQRRQAIDTREEAMLGSIRAPLTRRTMLASGAAMIAAPALAENCQLGPPTHDKGPVVWMNLDQVELDAAYDQTFYAPLARLIQKRRAANADAMRARLGQPLRKAYGPTEIEKLDIYRAKKSNAPIFVFIHGGAWLGGTARQSWLSCRDVVNAGAHFVVLDFIAIKEAGGDLRRDGRAGPARHRLGLQERQGFRRRRQPPLHRRPFRRASLRRRAGHRLAEGFRPARRYREAAGCA